MSCSLVSNLVNGSYWSLSFVAVIHYFLSPLLVAHGFIPILLSNLLYMVAGSYYHYLNFLGYDGKLIFNSIILLYIYIYKGWSTFLCESIHDYAVHWGRFRCQTPHVTGVIIYKSCCSNYPNILFVGLWKLSLTMAMKKFHCFSAEILS